MREIFENDFLPFIRKKDYIFKKWLTPGGTGQTVLIHDDSISMDFVCKKFVPTQKEYEDRCYQYFIEEIKILYSSFHKNVVRIFNHYIYPDSKTGFIIMEYIQGDDIATYLAANTTQINNIFIQLIDGFLHLESIGILHRDIRSSNIIVSNVDNTVKIIDFGYGKIHNEFFDGTTSLYLNWTNGVEPVEISDKRYTTATDIYFLGRLFEKIIADTDNNNFEFESLLKQMTEKSPDERISSFLDIKKQINKQSDMNISGTDKKTYNSLANSIVQSIEGLYSSPQFYFDDEKILRNLSDLLKKTAWEDEISNISMFVGCFFENIDCNYRSSWEDDYGNYVGKYTVEIKTVKDFIDMFSILSKEKRTNLLENLYYNRILNIYISERPVRSLEQISFSDELPF